MHFQFVQGIKAKNLTMPCWNICIWNWEIFPLFICVAWGCVWVCVCVCVVINFVCMCLM